MNERMDVFLILNLRFLFKIEQFFEFLLIEFCLIHFTHFSCFSLLQIYRGSETKFTIENLEPAGLYQFRVCPIRVTNSGEDLLGPFTSPFRYLVPLIPPFDEIDDNLLTNAAASMIASLNAAGAEAASSCHGHGHAHHHAHHHHNAIQHSHHNSRHSGHHGCNSGGDNSTSTNVHHRSVSASAASSSSSSSNKIVHANGNHNGSAASNNTLLIGSNAMGFIPIGSVASELAASFAGCDDPNHNHHHHHHAFHDNAAAGHNGNASTAAAAAAVSTSSNAVAAQSTASLLAASANQLFANNPILLQAATAAISHHQHILDNQRHQQHGSVLRRFATRLGSVYTNRKRFSDQEKAVIFMISFLFFTFLFASLVKTFMR